MIRDLLNERMVLSFEVFPPKTDPGMQKLTEPGGVIDRLCDLRPDYISCTYGAGGTNVGRNMEVLRAISRRGRTIPLTHLTCIGNTKEDIARQLQEFLDAGVSHVLALRGDIPLGWDDTCGDFHYATELVAYIRRMFGSKFTVAVAGSPEGHIECRSFEADIAFLKQKQDNGADYIMTQLCWDMEAFARWLDAIRRAGVTLPVDVGILPVQDPAAMIRLAYSRNGCVIPAELTRMIARHWIFPNVFRPEEDPHIVEEKKRAFREEGLEYTIRQIDQYRALGVHGIHLYALNRTEAVTTLVRRSGIIDLI